jgi:hypothetical protein
VKNPRPSNELAPLFEVFAVSLFKNPPSLPPV